jgi:hypothetical protein
LKKSTSRATVPTLPALVLAIGAPSACTPLDDPEDIYEDDSTLEIGQELPDARRSGPIDESQPTGDDPWSCIEGRRPLLPPPEGRPETVTYTVSIVDWVTQEAPPGLTIRVCNRIDALCNEPLAVVTPEPSRQVSFPLPARFEVYLVLEATEHVPATYYFDGPVTESRVGGLIQLLRLSTAAGLAQQFLGTQLDPTMGVLALRSYDCNGAIAAGAVFEMEPNMGVPYTLINGAPTRSIVPTDASGIAGFANVPQGGFLVRGFVADDTREFGLANFTVAPANLNIVEVRSAN